MVLLLLGIEPSTSHEVRLQVTQAIIEICLSVGEEDVVEIEVVCLVPYLFFGLVDLLQYRKPLSATKYYT